MKYTFEQNSGLRPGGVLHSLNAVIYSVSQKKSPWCLPQFFQNGWEFFDQIVQAYYAFLSTLDYEFLFN